MDISFNDLRNKEVINLTDGSRMGHIIDLIFNHETGVVVGFLVPGERKFFKKNEDVFISLEKVRRIGDDVILVRMEVVENLSNRYRVKDSKRKNNYSQAHSLRLTKANGSFIRYRKLDNKKYK